MDAQLERAVADQEALSELRAEAATEQDHDTLNQMQEQLDTQRKQALNERIGQFTVRDNVVVKKDEVAAMRAAGQDMNDRPYDK